MNSFEAFPLVVREEYTTIDSPYKGLIVQQAAELCGGSYSELPTETEDALDSAARLAAQNERLEGDLGEFLQVVALLPRRTADERYATIVEGLRRGTLRIAQVTVSKNISRQYLGGKVCDLLQTAYSEFGDPCSERRGFLEPRGILEKTGF